MKVVETMRALKHAQRGPTGSVDDFLMHIQDLRPIFARMPGVLTLNLMVGLAFGLTTEMLGEDDMLML